MLTIRLMIPSTERNYGSDTSPLINGHNKDTKIQAFVGCAVNTIVLYVPESFTPLLVMWQIQFLRTLNLKLSCSGQTRECGGITVYTMKYEHTVYSHRNSEQKPIGFLAGVEPNFFLKHFPSFDKLHCIHQVQATKLSGGCSCILKTLLWCTMRTSWKVNTTWYIQFHMYSWHLEWVF